MEQFKYIGSIIGAFLGGIFGGYDGFLYALIVMMVVDYISGVLVAINRNKLSSDIGRKGITKKAFMLLIVIMGNIIDTNLIGQGNVVRTAVIFFYIMNECISIIENAGNLGLPVPKKLVKILEQIEDTEGLYGDNSKDDTEQEQRA